MALHPLLHVLTTQPELLVTHGRAYADLVVEEVTVASEAYRRKVLLLSVVLVCVGASAVLAGVAVMLWAMLPGAPDQALGVLIGIPLLPLLCAGACWWAMRQATSPPIFDKVRAQLRTDMQMLREVSTP
jgi:uncharacterized membrane protein YqjE